MTGIGARAIEAGSDTLIDVDSSAFMSVLGTEHFVHQSIAGATISESGTRSAIYLSTLSS